MDASDVEAVLAEQVAFYRAWAPTYDEAVRRDANELDGPELRRALASFGPVGDVLELAGGTGVWTVEVAGYADSLTVVDASPEALVINREKLEIEGLRPEYVCVDVFDWCSPRRYDVVFFSFWLSHVPRARFAQFWQLVDEALRPDGRVFFIDSAVPRHQPADSVPGSELVSRDDDPDGDLSWRKLSNGCDYRIVKIHWQPADLEGRLRSLGFRVSVQETAHGQCIYGHGGRHT
jgi:SAM-dependent methyltransferase